MSRSLLSWGVALVAGAAAPGCVKSDLVDCGDGRTCPVGTVCDTANATCLDPRGVDVPTAALDFASLGCGTSAELMLPLRNYGVSPIDFTVTSTVSGVSVSPETGTIDPGDGVVLTVTATSEGLSIPGVTVDGSLVISSSFEQIVRTVRMTTVGALVHADATLDFGENALGDVGARSFAVTNAGNAPTELTVTVPSGAFGLVNGGGRLDAGQSARIDVQFQPGAIQAFGATATLAFSGAQCQPPPTSVMLSGTASGDAVLSTQTVLDFGTTDCTEPERVQSFTLTNQTATAQTVTFSMTGDQDAYKLPDPTTIPASGSVAIDVVRKPIAIEAVGGKLATLVVVAQPANLTKMITLTHKIAAPVLGPATTAVNLGVVNTYGSASKVVMIANTGNATAAVTVQPPMQMFGDATLVVSPSSFQIAPQSTRPVQVSLTAGGEGVVFPATTRIALAADGQCSQTPSITVAGEVKK